MKNNHVKLFGNNRNYYDRLVIFNMVIMKYITQQRMSLWFRLSNLINYSYLKAVQNGESVGILLKMAKDIDAAPALLARNVLERYCIREDMNGTVNIQLSQSKTMQLTD